MPPAYPINEFAPAMKGMVIGGVGIVHVFLAQFAIGGGLLLLYFEWVAQKRGDRDARLFVDSYFKFLVLLSFVAGAVTGVAMWLVAIQVSARTMGAMVERFHWIWAIEWTFFALEVVAGYSFYKLGARLKDRDRLRLLALYAVASWFSLFWINGILSWQLTPGGASFWSSFFNPSFFPSLAYRTIAAMTIAGLVACVVINQMSELDRERRGRLVSRASRFLIPMLLMPILGAWFVAVIPEDSRGWLTGGSPAMTMFVAVAAGASLLIGLYAVLGLWRQKLYINGATALLCAPSLSARRVPVSLLGRALASPTPFVRCSTPIRLLQTRSSRCGALGVDAVDPYPLVDRDRYPTEQLALGAKVFRFQCSVCHTLDAANGLTHLAGLWTREQLRLNIAKLQLTKPFMPPFAGTPSEVEAVSELIRWASDGEPASWAAPMIGAEGLARIKRYLEEAGAR